MRINTFHRSATRPVNKPRLGCAPYVQPVNRVADTIAALHRAVALLVEHGDDDVHQIATALDLWSEQTPGDDCVALDVILGLGAMWRSDRRRDARDAALLRLRERLCPLLYGRAAARAVTTAVRRYEASTWRHDRLARRRPDGIPGLAYDVLAHGAAVQGPEQMRHLFPVQQQVAAAG